MKTYQLVTSLSYREFLLSSQTSTSTSRIGIHVGIHVLNGIINLFVYIVRVVISK